MNLLLDTHVLLWWLRADDQLAADARSAITTADAAFVSTASAWEISIKRARGKLKAPDDLVAQLSRHAFSVLPIHLDHALLAGELPPLHRDPFDRMLVAQATIEGLVVVTGDPNIPRYDVKVIAATTAPRV